MPREAQTRSVAKRLRSRNRRLARREPARETIARLEAEVEKLSKWNWSCRAKIAEVTRSGQSLFKELASERKAREAAEREIERLKGELEARSQN